MPLVLRPRVTVGTKPQHLHTSLDSLRNRYQSRLPHILIQNPKLFKRRENIRVREEAVDDEPHRHRIYSDLGQRNILQPGLRR